MLKVCMGDVNDLRQFILEDCAPPQLVSSDAAAPVGDRPGRRVWTFELDVMLLCARCPETAALLYHSPFSRVLQIVKLELLEVMRPHTNLQEHELCVRPIHVPPLLCATAPSHSMGTEGTLVQLSGTIIRLCAKRVVPYEQHFQCPLCRKEMRVPTDPADRPQPHRPRCDSKGCKSAHMVEVGNVWMDYSECRLQQRGRSGGGGNLPRSVLVTLDDELASKFTAGQAVKVVGMARSRWKQTAARATPRVELVVWALNVTAQEREGGEEGLLEGGVSFSPEAFANDIANSHILRTRLLQSTCPQLSGVVGPRLGLLLASLGGSEVRDARSGHRVRGTVHCLFVGDPSTGKSELLRFAVALAPRSVMTTGFTSTSAGLTAAATKEFGEWALEPGALVLSDGGSCVIDELRTVSASDRTALHEAMEQQTISVAKAGLVAKLRTECSVIAACNPPMKRGSSASGAEVGELGVGGPLLSRFDLIFILWDTATYDHDLTVASHILHCSSASSQPLLQREELRDYLNYSRCRYSREGGPLLSPEAAQLIAAYYELQRARGASPALSDAIPVTVRLLESLVRLTQAHAKLTLKDTSDLWDAALALFLMERTGHALKARINGMSTADGSQLYTSSKELEDCFMDHSPHGVQCQQQVLQLMVDTFGVHISSNNPLLDMMSQCTSNNAGLHPTSPLNPSPKQSFRESASPVSLSPPITEYDDKVSLNGRAVAVYASSTFQPTSQADSRHSISLVPYKPGVVSGDDPSRPIDLPSQHFSASQHPSASRQHFAARPPASQHPSDSQYQPAPIYPQLPVSQHKPTGPIQYPPVVNANSQYPPAIDSNSALLARLRELRRPATPAALVPPELPVSAIPSPSLASQPSDAESADSPLQQQLAPPVTAAVAPRLGMGGLRGGGFKAPRPRDESDAPSAEDVMRSLRFSFRK